MQSASVGHEASTQILSRSSQLSSCSSIVNCTKCKLFWGCTGPDQGKITKSCALDHDHVLMVPEQVWDWRFVHTAVCFFVFCLFCLSLFGSFYGFLRRVNLAVLSSSWECRFLCSYERYLDHDHAWSPLLSGFNLNPLLWYAGNFVFKCPNCEPWEVVSTRLQLSKLFWCVLFMICVMQQCPVDLFNFVVSSPWLRLSTRGSPEVELQPLDILALLVADDSSPIFESDSFRLHSGFSMSLSCCLRRVLLAGV